MKYKVIVVRGFNDTKVLDKDNNPLKRNIGDTFECSKDRFHYLYENKAVQLIEIKKGK